MGGGLDGGASRGGCTILAPNTLAARGSFQILADYKNQVTTPLTRDRVSPGNAGGGGSLTFGGLSTSAFGAGSNHGMRFDDEEEYDNNYPPTNAFVSTLARALAGDQVQCNNRKFVKNP